jgi:hypothetical protein
MAVNLMHSFERLTRAQRPMATKAGSLQDRLDNAFKEMLGLSADELPQDLQSSYQSIWDRLSGAQNHRLTDQDAETLAKEFFDLYVQVNQQRAGVI